MSNPTAGQLVPPARAFVDTNIIIRLLTGDDPAKQQAARALFVTAQQGVISLILVEAVVAEAVYVLSSARLYHLPRPQVTALLTGICLLPNVEVSSRTIVLAALALYGSSNLDFEDALIVATMQEEGAQVVYSYDTYFDRVQSIVRHEP